METSKEKFATIDAYISSFTEDVQSILKEIRSTVQQAAPEAEETIKYDMPTYVFHGNLVYFAAFKKHIGFYALPKGDDAFQKEISVYKQGRGSIQFPLNQPMPLKLITKIVKLRVEENRAKAKK